MRTETSSPPSLFDLYEGDRLPPGKRSLAIEVTFQPRDHTLTDAETDAAASKVVAAVAKATGGTLRSQTLRAGRGSACDPAH